MDENANVMQQGRGSDSGLGTGAVQVEQPTLFRRRPRSRTVKTAAAGSLAAVMSLGGLGIAAAATTGTNGATHLTATNAPAGAPLPGGPGGRFGGQDPGGFGPGGGPGGLQGTVSAVGAGSVTITRADGTSVTFTTSSSTKVDKDGSASTLSALAVGDQVSVSPVRGSLSTGSTSTSSNAAGQIDIRSPTVQGTVVAVGNGTLTVKDAQGFWRTVKVDGSTTYTNGGAAGSSSDVSVGTQIVAIGAVDADHSSLDATSVEVVLPRVSGTVQSVSGSVITLRTDSGATETVTTTSSTVYRSGRSTATASAVKVGAMVMAEGATTSSTALSATSVTVLPARAMPGMG